MSVRLDGDVLRLEGDCAVEEAEAVVGLLQSGGVAGADLGQCRQVHSAVVQALLAFAVPVAGASEDLFLRNLVVPALEAARAGRSERQPATQTVEDQSTSEAWASLSERS